MFSLTRGANLLFCQSWILYMSFHPEPQWGLLCSPTPPHKLYLCYCFPILNTPACRLIKFLNSATPQLEWIWPWRVRCIHCPGSYWYLLFLRSYHIYLCVLPSWNSKSGSFCYSSFVYESILPLTTVRVLFTCWYLRDQPLKGC